MTTNAVGAGTEPPMKIEELIERLEKATGPDRELDIDIWLATKVGWKDINYSQWLGCQPKGSVTSDRYYARLRAPRFTKLIDAALTLVLKGLHWSCSPEHDDRRHSVYRPYSGEEIWPRWEGVHKHDAIALCMAALRALSATREK